MKGKNKSVGSLLLSQEQVRACDAIAMEKFSIDGVVLMENAGSAAARLILSLLDSPRKSKVCIIAGAGNNAGDGFVVARHLYNASVAVDVLMCVARDRFRGDALRNLQIIEKMQLPIHYLPAQPNDISIEIMRYAESSDIIVDAMLGTGTFGPPREPMRTVIETVNEVKKQVVSLDIPSGLDCDTGEPLEVAIKADYTITFAAMKKGFQSLRAAAYTGEIQVASIGINTHLLLQE